MKKFIVTGIQMGNKGSQAMFLSLYYGLKAVYKDCQITAFALQYDSPEKYTFKILPWDANTRILFNYRLHKVPLLANLMSLLGRFKKWRGTIATIDKTLREADVIFDASGYNLGSGWSKQTGYSLLLTIRIARRYKKKIILMPQSFGPFDWGEKNDADFINIIKKDLTYPVKIFSRETEGYECLTSLGLKNVELSADMVIRESLFPKVSDIYASSDRAEINFPVRNSVGFILNENMFRIGDPKTVEELYAQIIDKLIDDGEKVYILRTSNRDIDYIANVLGAIRHKNKVKVITEEYSSPELIDIIGKFKYIIASRYHSIVFAYRNAVPAIMLGWSSKYDDLAKLFGQEDYVFDIRDLRSDLIIEKINKMSANCENESSRIKCCLEQVQATSVLREAIKALG